ncbi:serine/threonine-protein kinase PCRK1-like [Andrographis paniculata]|uniref:serine/threonine-protein kinase PCRK1-like n=1 Tax=Andrographis paniculata TaxID=175694 RepID=UPI0021E7879B|nr:serine/threonine-protein kinase PCRK1-like [Andrographis paniculata]XP_051152542.1 serine/threonine-protein kinase PCRK1-like [Andrographis paniculata]
MKCFQFHSGEQKNNSKSGSKTSSSPFSFTAYIRRRHSTPELNTRSKSTKLRQFQNLSAKPSDNLNVFTLSELRQATKNFSNTAKIGEGGFGCVFKGMIRCADDPSKKINVAIKQLGQKGRQGHKEWVTEVNLLSIVDHPNLVKLIGYCAEDDERGIQRLLIYEYMPNGSVEDHLSAKAASSLPWDSRLKIASDAARGLEYLHKGMDFQIIFRDFKSSNILLDEEWNAKLSDFGLARLGPSDGRTHVSTAVAGTMGYAAPEYVRTGHLKAKSDIWSYGVFLYELITGRRPMERNLPKNEQKLLEWVKPYVSDSKKFQHILDPRLEGGNHVLKSACKLSLVANRCLAKNPKSRPEISQVREMVNQVLEESSTYSSTMPSPLLAVEEPQTKGRGRSSYS